MCAPLVALLPALASAAGTAGAAGAAAAGLSTLQVVSLAATAIGGVASAYGQYEQGKSQQAVLDNNAKRADYEAQDSIKRGQENVSRQLLKSGQIRGAQRAGLAASGVDINSGSPLAILMDTQALGEQDAQTLSKNAAREAEGKSFEASNLRYQGKVARRNGTSGAVSSLLTTGATVADKWYSYQR